MLIEVQVFISYGPKSAMEFLSDHGFVPEQSPDKGMW